MTATTDAPPRPTAVATPPSRWRRFVFGDESQPRWVRPAVFALLICTTVLYLWGLGSSGWANSYYAAAAQAGTQDWKAWLFGSLDPGNAITVDKPPASLWVMGLFGRVFGFSPFTMLLPQALMGVGTAGVLYSTVRRCSGYAAGLIAGAVLALTPVAALMFRFNNPDALLVLLLVVAAYCTVRGTESGSTRWMALTGGVVGLAFLTKMLQALLVVPALALVFLVAAPMGLAKRIGALAVGALTMVVSAGWFLALVSLWPADSRPYIGGSTDNSLLQLALGYNGIQRILGGQGPGPGGPPGGPPPGPPGGGPPGGNIMFGGDPGVGRLFGLSMGTEISWLLPAALIGLVAGLWFTRRTPRTGRVRAALLLWGGWLLVSGAVFSFMDGIIHPYYTVALAPAVAALIGIAVRELWRDRQIVLARAALAAMLAATGVWGFILLDRTPDWVPVLRWIVLSGSVMTAAVIVVGVHRLRPAGAVIVVAAAAVFGLAATAGYTVETVAQDHHGPMSLSGPPRDIGGPPPGKPGSPGPPGPPGGPGGIVDDALVDLVAGADNRWSAATVGSMLAGDLQLQSGGSVMAIGGFTGADDSPTLAQFQRYVADGAVGYFIEGGRMGPPGPPGGRGGSAEQITGWVQQHFTPVDVGGSTVYDLSAPLP